MIHLPHKTSNSLDNQSMLENTTTQSGRYNFVHLIFIFLIALICAFTVRFFIAEPFRVPTGSMEQTIMPGDLILAEKLSINFGSGPHTGDVVTFHNPDASSNHGMLIKRVVATQGQIVDLIDGNLFVDGEKIDEPYIQGESWPLASSMPGVTITFPYTVPEGYLWCMGDNRENSADSRFFGPVPCDLVTAHAVFCYWPINHVGLIK